MTDILRWPNELLKTPVPKFDFEKHNAVVIANQLAEAMLEHEGIGLAANQIGLPFRAFAIMAEQIIVMFNPILVDASEESSYIVEGCLSSPNLFLNVKRPNSIRVRWAQPNGEVETREFGGITARVIQHELPWPLS